MKKIFFIASALIATNAAVSAQGPSAIRLRLEPGSLLSISGTSSLHDFTCKTQKMNVYVDVDPNYTKDLTKISNPSLIAIATSGSGGMNRFLFGSVADKVTRRSAMSLLVFHPRRGVVAESTPDSAKAQSLAGV